MQLDIQLVALSLWTFYWRLRFSVRQIGSFKTS